MPDEQHKYTYEPRLLRHADVERYIWGDDESGHVVDWYHRNSDKLIVSLFSLAPGARWTHSEMHKSFYDADEGYYILQGSLTFHNGDSERCRSSTRERRSTSGATPFTTATTSAPSRC